MRSVACVRRNLSSSRRAVSSLDDGGRQSVRSTKLAITAISRIVRPEMQLREENHCLRFNTGGGGGVEAGASAWERTGAHS